ncbi:hypothetical protein [Bordetella sp. 2513F-2]
MVPAADIADTLPEVINAWGTPTPYGVSRSSPGVAQAAARALQAQVDVEALHDAVGRELAARAQAESACLCHCAAAAVSLAAAACLSGEDPARVAALPECDPPRAIAIQAEHCVDYGQPIVQALKLSGARVAVLEGGPARRLGRLAALAATGELAGVVAVASTLVDTPAPLALPALAHACRTHGVPLLLDAAARDWQLADPAARAGVDLAIYSAHKYLAAPTCGMLVGRAALVRAARLNLRGLGRGFKPTKEALAGVRAALAERDGRALAHIQAGNEARARAYAQGLRQVLPACAVTVLQGSDYGPYPRIALQFEDAPRARRVADALAAHQPPIVVGRHAQTCGRLTIELTYVDEPQAAQLRAALRAACAA